MDDLQQMIQWLAFVAAKNIRHRNHERVVELASDYHAYVTGDGLDDMMQQFVMRESNDAFKQRQAITQHIIPSVVNNITSVERKVPRSNGKHRVLAYKGDEQLKKADDLDEILKQYWGTMSLDDWMATRWIELNDIDPNTFVVIEWDEFDGNTEKALPYPYESNSTEAIMFEFINNILQYLIDFQNDRYTLYGKNQTIQAVKLSEEEAIRILKFFKMDEIGTAIEIKGVWYFRTDDKTVYQITIFEPHDLGVVPAFRAGYKRDELTDGDTFVSPYNDCVPYLQKTLKANSELDLTMALHAFPQKLVTARKCYADGCMDGYIHSEGSKTQCKTCKGTGFAVHSSAQDIVYIPIPRGKDEQLSLDNLVRYVSPEVALLEFQRLYIEYLTNECMQAVFNSDVFTKEDIATTATEKRIDLDNIYDTLYPMAIMFGRTWEFKVNIIAKIDNLEEDLIASMTFNKDFKFKSKDDYIADRKAAQDAGTPDAILRNIDDDIMRIDTSDNPREFKVYKTVQSFDPFSGKKDEEIATAVASDTVPFDIKVLYNNMGWIFDSIFIEHTDFFDLNRKKQVAIVEDKVEEIVEELRPGSTTKSPTDALAAGAEGVSAEAAELEAKAKLRGTVGGVQGILSINEAVQQGTMSKVSAATLLVEIYGFDQATAEKLVQEPDKKKVQQIVTDGQNSTDTQSGTE